MCRYAYRHVYRRVRMHAHRHVYASLLQIKVLGSSGAFSMSQKTKSNVAALQSSRQLKPLCLLPSVWFWLLLPTSYVYGHVPVPAVDEQRAGRPSALSSAMTSGFVIDRAQQGPANDGESRWQRQLAVGNLFIGRICTCHPGEWWYSDGVRALKNGQRAGLGYGCLK